MNGRFFAANRRFFIAFMALELAMLLLLVTSTKADSFLLLNGYHRPALDYFFIIYTNAGDGLFSLGAALIFILRRQALMGLEIAVAFLFSGAIVQLLKFLFPMPRPSVWLAHVHYTHFIDHVTLTGHASFPSGHSASAFALATLLSLFDKNKMHAYVYLLAALLVAYSRIYLGQHFVQDVFWGSVDGFGSAMLVWWFCKRWRQSAKDRGGAIGQRGLK